MLQYKKLENQGFIPVPQDEIRNLESPYYLFLGGLLHQNGMGFGAGLATILQDVTWQKQGSQLPVYVALQSTEFNIGRTATAMYDFQKNEILAPEAYALVDDIVSPVAFTDTAEASRIFSRMNLIGYSYGVSLIQQAEKILADRLGENRSVLGAVGAVNIGPAAQPYLYKQDGDTVRLGRNVDIGDASGLFTQAFFLRLNDKNNDDTMQQAMTGGMTQDSEISSYGPESTKVICDVTGDAYMRRIGVSKLLGGASFPLITHSIDPEGHDLRLYTNRLCVANDIAVFPSIATADLLCETIRAMGHESYGAAGALKRQFQCVAAEQAVREQGRDIASLHNIFADALSRFQSDALVDGIQRIRTLVDEVKAMPSKIPAPQVL